MKALILTNIELSELEKHQLLETKIFKLAINQHAEELKPDARIFSDYVNLTKQHLKFPNEIIYSVRERLRQPCENIREINIDFKGSTIIAAIELLINLKFDELLLVADNTVHGKEFQDQIIENIKILREQIKIYQITDGNFPVEIKEIKDFLWNT